MKFDPSTRAPALAGGASLGMSPQTDRGVVLSERSESKDDENGAPGKPGGLHIRNAAFEIAIDRRLAGAILAPTSAPERRRRRIQRGGVSLARPVPGCQELTRTKPTSTNE